MTIEELNIRYNLEQWACEARYLAEREAIHARYDTELAIIGDTPLQATDGEIRSLDEEINRQQMLDQAEDTYKRSLETCAQVQQAFLQAERACNQAWEAYYKAREACNRAGRRGKPGLDFSKLDKI